MMPPDKLTDKNVALLEGPETLELYLKEISQNLEKMIEQAGMLETTIIEMKKQLPASVAAEQPMAYPNSARSITDDSA
jgi:hypothetical protein